MKLVSGLTRKTTMGNLELGQPFEYQGDAHIFVKAYTPSQDPDKLPALNLTTMEVVPINKGSEVFRLEAKMVFE